LLEFRTGKSEAVPIKNENGRLQEEIDRMVADGEKFAAEKIEVLSSFSSFVLVYGLKNRVTTLRALVARLMMMTRRSSRTLSRWPLSGSPSASVEDLEENLASGYFVLYSRLMKAY
jgi:hypothetical protein